MDLFQYRYGGGKFYPEDDRLVRILITDGPKNNVTAWYGYGFKAIQHTLSRDAIDEIEDIISKQDRLFEENKLDSFDNQVATLDVPIHHFSLECIIGKAEFASQMIDSEHVAKSNIDLMVDLVYGIQEIMQKDGVDVTIWEKDEFLRFKD